MRSVPHKTQRILMENDTINVSGVQKAPGRTLTLLNTRKSKYKVEIEGKIIFIISTSQNNFFLESLI